MWKRKAISLSVQEIAAHVNGSLQGEGHHSITDLAAFTTPSSLALSFTKEKRSTELQKECHQKEFGALLVTPEAVFPAPFPLITVSDPFKAFRELLPLFYERSFPLPEISSKAEVHPSATLHEGVSVGAFAVIGRDVVIGEGTVIHPHVVLYDQVKIGKHCVIHSGAVLREGVVIENDVVIQNNAVLGADGFGYVFDPAQGLVPVPQVGTVTIRSKVEIGANTCIDRAALGSTTVGYGTKVDNLVQIGHNNQIGSHCIICGAAGIAGSCTIGDGVVIGGGAGIKDHVHLASGVRVAARAGVISDLKEKGDYAGFPAVPAFAWRRQMHALSVLGGKKKRKEQRQEGEE